MTLHSFFLSVHSFCSLNQWGLTYGNGLHVDGFLHTDMLSLGNGLKIDGIYIPYSEHAKEYNPICCPWKQFRP